MSQAVTKCDKATPCVYLIHDCAARLDWLPAALNTNDRVVFVLPPDPGLRNQIDACLEQPSRCLGQSAAMDNQADPAISYAELVTWMAECPRVISL